MTIDMDAPFAEFAEKHLKKHKGNNSGSLAGCTAFSSEEAMEVGPYVEGLDAASRGDEHSLNPYDFLDDQYDAWSDGWWDATEEMCSIAVRPN